MKTKQNKIRLNVRNLFLASTFALFITSSATGAQSGITCEGSDCAVLSLTQNTLNSILQSFQEQYVNKVFDDMAEASAVANIAGPPVGTINLTGFTVGVAGSAAFIKPYNMDVYIPNVGTMEDLPSAGGAVNPRIFVGFNLGRIFGISNDPFSGDPAPSMLSPARFDLYFSGMKIHDNLPNRNNFNGNVEARIFYKSFDLRYHLMEGGRILGGPMLRFRGVSLGAGYHESFQDVDFRQSADPIVMGVNGQDIVWEGENHINLETKVKSYPIEINTGIQFLYLFNLSIGGGFSRNSGYARFNMDRVGRAYLQSDLLASLGIDPPEAILSAFIAGDGEVKSQINYLKLGLEINLLNLKVTVGGIKTERTYGVNIGLRVEL